MRHVEAVEQHHARFWSAPIRRIRLEAGRISELPADFCVLAFAYSSSEIAYATCGMSQPEDEHRLELHLLTRSAPADDHGAAELLTAIAHYHRTGARLGHGHTVNFGRPWMPGSSCTHGLLSLPYLDGPRLEWVEEPRVRCLWLIPITLSELQFKKSFGLDALEEQFEKHEFDYLDPHRPSVV